MFHLVNGGLSPDGQVDVLRPATYGDMSNTPCAAFDPIFWFHHSNVERLYARWQLMRPHQPIPPTLEDHFEMVPFTGPDGKFFTFTDM